MKLTVYQRKRLSPTQVKSAELRLSGHSWREAGKILGKDASTCRHSWNASMGRLKDSDEPLIDPMPKTGGAVSHFDSGASAEKIGIALDEGTDSFQSLKEAAEACGFPENVLSTLLNRLKKRYTPVAFELKEIKDKQLAGVLRDKARMALGFMDEFSASKATFKDLATSVGVLVDKAQLLEGKPTAIMGRGEREQLDDLLPKLLEEASRRGITLQGEKVPYSEVE